MSEAILVRRGGSGLDFRVLGGESAPSAPREKDIWVSTAQPIRAFALSTEQPQGQEGLLWIQAGSASPVAFPADRRGQLRVYPERCFLYSGGAWAAKTAKSYLGGAWVDWRTYLFREGEGPVNAFRVTSYNDTVVDGAVTTESIRISSSYNAVGQRGLSSLSPIDLSGFQKLYVELIANTNNWTMGVALGQILYNTSLVRSSGTIPTLANQRKTVAIDVSELTGLYYVGGKNGADETTNVTIYKIWGE